MLDRFRYGGLLMIPSWSTIPVGWPSFQLKRSPFVPTTVASPETAFSIAVTRPRPVIVPFARTGSSE